MKESRSLNLYESTRIRFTRPPEEVGFTINYVQIKWFSFLVVNLEGGAGGGGGGGACCASLYCPEFCNSFWAQTIHHLSQGKEEGTGSALLTQQYT